jgi:hypothetical protein
MFIKPYAYICYVDHGCAVYSEHLDFTNNTQHAQFLRDFLLNFIAKPKRWGRDPTVQKENDMLYIRHAEYWWLELPNGLLWYRPSLIGRNIRVASVERDGADGITNNVVMKSTWEEKLSPESLPPPEVEVLDILLAARVRGLPQPYDVDSVVVNDDGNLEAETRRFPKISQLALPASKSLMKDIQNSYVSNHTSKNLALGASKGITDNSLSSRSQQAAFNQPLYVRRRLTRLIMSYCKPLKEAMRSMNPKSLMQIIRDAMIVYYEAYKRPKSGFIHGGKNSTNTRHPRH